MIAEWKEVLDIEIDIPVRYDYLAIQEIIEVVNPILPLDVYELLSINEQFIPCGQLYFEVAHQKGICIVKVSGW